MQRDVNDHMFPSETEMAQIESHSGVFPSVGSSALPESTNDLSGDTADYSCPPSDAQFAAKAPLSALIIILISCVVNTLLQ